MPSLKLLSFLLLSGEYLVLPSGNLQIVSVSAQHQGMYKCGAFNPVTGETVVQPHGTKLTVKRKSDVFLFTVICPLRSPLLSTNVVRSFVIDSDSPSSVRIVYPTAPLTVSVQLSQPLMLECIVSGSPAPAAKWFKNGKEVAPGPPLQRQHNNLAFAAVARSDEGSYTCAADTEQGTVTSANYTVNILGKINRMRTFFRRAGTVCSRTDHDVDVPASPPQSLCLLRRVCPTRSSRPALLLVSPAWLKETLPQTSPGCSTPSPSPHRIASGSPDPHWLLMM